MNFPRDRAARCLAAVLLLPAALAAAGFDFAILGDRTGGAVPGVYEKVVREIALHHPAFVINTGDTIQGMDDVTTKDEWDAVRPVWKAFGDIPFYLVPGNHDIWSPASLRLWRSETGRPTHYSFDFRGAHITVLDNSRTSDLAEDQLTFLESDLAAHAARQPKFIFFHRPFWLLPIKFQNGDFPLHRIAKKHGVSWIISGHGHFFDRSSYDGIEYVMVGSSGGSLDHGGGNGKENQDTGSFYGYGWVHIENGAAKLEIRHVTP
jgi:hypothetical protein